MIVIYGIKEYLNPIKPLLSDVIQGCMHKVLMLPDEKRAHRFIPMDAEDMYYPDGRSPAYTVIEINLMAGRKTETLRALIKSLFANIEEKIDIKPIDIEIIIKEQPAHCWGFRGMTGDEARDLSYRIDV